MEKPSLAVFILSGWLPDEEGIKMFLAEERRNLTGSGWLPDEEGIKMHYSEAPKSFSGLDGYLMKKVLRFVLFPKRITKEVWMVT